MKPLYDDSARLNPLGMRHGVPYAHVVARASGEDADSIRAAMNLWFSHLPDSARMELRGRLSSSDDGQFHGAFWELYLHETLLRLGFEVTCHPALEAGSRQPDFLASREGKPVFYLEATSTNDAREEVGARARVNSVYASIAEIESDDFFTWLVVEEQGSQPPALKRLRAHVQSWLRGLDANFIEQQFRSELLQSPSLVDLPSTNWIDAGWNITIRAVAKKQEARGLPVDSSLGVWGTRALQVNDASQIRKALRGKGSAYGRFEVPYVIAIRTDHIFPSQNDVMDALFGSSMIEIRTYSDGRRDSIPARSNDGYWLQGSAWRHTNVSAVLCANGLAAGSHTQVTPTLWLHPAADFPLEPLSPWRTARISAEGEAKISEEKISPGEFLAS